MNRWHSCLALAGAIAVPMACTPTPSSARLDSGATDSTVNPDTTVIPDTTVSPDTTVIPDTVVPTGDTPTAPTDGAPLPNMTINRTRIPGSLLFQWKDFGPSSCEVVNHCVNLAGSAPERHRLMRFDLETPNLGPGDIHTGRPTPANRPAGVFEFDSCSNSWHLLGYAVYDLLAADSDTELAHGHKDSFCFEDSRRTGLVPEAPTMGRYNCNDQGIQAGWADIYGRLLDCQFVDITNVPAGNYRLRVRINVRRGIPENDYTDNEAIIPVTIPVAGDAGTPDAGMPADFVMPCPAAAEGLARNCGWTADMPRTCTPGAMVQVGCNNNLCAPPLGTCTGDPIMRVCPGSTACSNIGALAQGDDSTMCGSASGSSLCPVFSFRCPPEGRYTVMTAPYRSSTPATCVVGAR